MRILYRSKHGNPITYEGWVSRFHDEQYRRVGATDLPNGCHVSTVWLGIDHGYGGRVLIFESMAFPPKGVSRDNLPDLDVARYATLEEAERGHAEMVARWREVRFEAP